MHQSFLLLERKYGKLKYLAICPDYENNFIEITLIPRVCDDSLGVRIYFMPIEKTYTIYLIRNFKICSNGYFKREYRDTKNIKSTFLVVDKFIRDFKNKRIY